MKKHHLDNANIWFLKNVYLLEEAYLGKNLLGGKGHGMVEMKHAGLPFSPGIIITTNVWYDTMRAGGKSEHPYCRCSREEEECRTEHGRKFGKSLLVSVRSGTPLSMPGMMDTILNLGLNDDVLQYLISTTATRRFC